MSASDIEKAKILSEALPYIQKYNQKTIVVKYGGNAMINEELRRAVISDIVLLSLVGIRVVVVHGGGPEINDMLSRVGKQPQFVGGLRYTDEETMDIVQMVLCGKVNKDLVSLIASMGGRAEGLSGLDGNLMSAERLTRDGIDYGLVGDIKLIDPTVVTNTLSGGHIPVIATVARGLDADTSYNINADTAAAKLAIALKAEKLVLLTDVKGLMTDPDDEATLLPVVAVHEVPALIKDGVIKGGMIPKIECCVEAVRHGVPRAHIIDGRTPHSILIETLSDTGIGTMIV